MRIPKRLLAKIQSWTEEKMRERKPDFYIGGTEDPYLIRWFVIPRNKWFNLYLHKILKSDRDEALHDHPWINMSLLVRGEYHEITIARGGVNNDDPLSAGELRFRRPSHAHRLVVKDDEPVVTLFFTGPVWRHWGFHCPNGWRHWKDFVGFRDSQQNVVGRGCGEMDTPGLPGGRISLFEPLKQSSDKRPG